MKISYQHQQGMTLVELLAAIALLGIVLVTFMTFFTQSAKFTAHNHETLTAVQVAEGVVAEVRTINKIEEMKKANNEITGDAILGKKITDEENYAPYTVTIEEKEAPITVLGKLKKAVITVESAPRSGIDEPEFTTEMYYKVN